MADDKSVARRISAPDRPRNESQVPFNLLAERSLLGAMLLCPELVPTVMRAGLRSDDFYLSAHRKIYLQVSILARSSTPIDIVSIEEELRRNGELNAVGGLAYLLDLIQLVVTEERHVLHHSKIVMSNASLRRIQTIAERAYRAAGVSGANPSELAKQLIVEFRLILSERRESGSCETTGHATEPFNDVTAFAFEAKGKRSEQRDT